MALPCKRTALQRSRRRLRWPVHHHSFLPSPSARLRNASVRTTFQRPLPHGPLPASWLFVHTSSPSPCPRRRTVRSLDSVISSLLKRDSLLHAHHRTVLRVPIQACRPSLSAATVVFTEIPSPIYPFYMLPTRILLAASRPKPNITGFDIRAYRDAAGKPRYDPWERAEAWRYEGPFTRWNRFRSALPGLGTASVAFAGYCAFEYLFLKDEDEHHAHPKE